MLRHFIVLSVDSLGACSRKVVKKPESSSSNFQIATWIVGLAMATLINCRTESASCNGSRVLALSVDRVLSFGGMYSWLF